MLRALLYRDDGQGISVERSFYNIDDWDLDANMKVWFEYPERTRFAKYGLDILYTPIFFGNEDVSGDICLEVNESLAHELPDLNAQITLYGEASLGVLNVGGRPASIYDSRYAFSHVGFRPVVRIPLLNETEQFPLRAGAYERNGVHGRRVPFSFSISQNNLAQLREITPSLKLISSDVETTLEGLKSHVPTMLVNVRYLLEAVLYHGEDRKQKIEQEIRIWVALDSSQVPDPMPNIGEHVAQHRRSSLVSLKRTRSLPFTSARRKSVHDAGDHLVIEAEAPEAFRFTLNNDAAATRVEMKLTIMSPDLGTGVPGPISANIEWLMKSLSTMAVQQTDRDPEAPASEDYFHLRTRHLPVKKSKITWSSWQRPDEDELTENAWTCTQDVWLTLATTSGLTPTFRTSFLSHSYTLWLQLNLSGKTLKGRSHKVELNIPVKLRYDVGLAPGYTVDQALPAYEVDEGAGTQQPGPGPDHPLEPPPAHEDADNHIHRIVAPRARYTVDELSDLIRNTGLRDGADRSPASDPLSPP